jgi:hypothetical protein
MRIRIRLATADGWETIDGEAPDGSDVECYALPRVNGEAACRAEFWTEKMGRHIPRTRGMIWTVLH